MSLVEPSTSFYEISTVSQGAPEELIKCSCITFLLMSTFLVTGVAGFIGSSIPRALIARGDTVRGIDNLSTGKRENLLGLESIEFIEGDLNSAGVAERGCRGVSFIFHQAALPSVPRSVEDPLSSNKANVDGTVTLLEI